MQRSSVAIMMKTPEQRRTPINSFRLTLSLTAHSRGTGIETMKTSVLIMLAKYRASAGKNLHDIEDNQGEIVGNSECTSICYG